MGAMNGLMGLLPNPGNWRDPRQVLDMASDFFVPGDWWNSQQQRLNNPLEAFGLDRMARGIMGLVNRDPNPDQWANDLEGTLRRNQRGVNRAVARQQGRGLTTNEQNAFEMARINANVNRHNQQAAEARERMDQIER